MSAASSEEKSNLDVLRRGFEAFQTGDGEALMKTIAPDAHYHLSPTGKLTGDYQGVQAIMEFFAQLARESDGTYRVAPMEMAAAGNRVFVLFGESGKRGGKTLDSRQVGVFTLADGVVSDAMFCPSDYPAEAAFWS
jgi:ketosteroid isomerase-like protein